MTIEYLKERALMIVITARGHEDPITMAFATRLARGHYDRYQPRDLVALARELAAIPFTEE